MQIHKSLPLLPLVVLAACQQTPTAPLPPPQPAVATPVHSLEIARIPQEWWHDTIFYEIWPRSFKDSDGDGHGDFNGMTDKLDYLLELGVDGIWLTPIFEAPSYHGYDFEDFYAVESDYGSMEDFDRFMAEAHARGIKVILDLVINHISNTHPWFIQSAARDPQYDDYFIWRADLPENWGRAWEAEALDPAAVWHWHEGRGEYYYGAFGNSQPDINLDNPEVVSAINDLATFWLEKGADGFRLDAVRYAMEEDRRPRAAQADTPATIAFWTGFTRHVKSIKPDALLVAEAWAEMEIVARYRDHGEGLDSAFDFDFGYVVIELLNGVERVADFGSVDTGERASGRDALWENLLERERYAPMAYYAPFLTNHDQVRVMHSLDNDAAKAKIAASLLLTSPGSIYLYYGEEIGLTQPLTGDDTYKRAIMQWENSADAGFNDTAVFWIDDATWVPWMENFSPWWSPFWETQRAIGGQTVAEQVPDPDSLWNHYRRLIEARRVLPAMAQPEQLRYYPVDAESVWMIESIAGDERVVVVINLDSIETVTSSVPENLRGPYHEQLGKQAVRIGASLILGPGDTLLLKAE